MHSEMALSLPVLEELLEDETLTALGQDLHLQGQQGETCSKGCHLCLCQGRARPGRGWAPGLSELAVSKERRAEKDYRSRLRKRTASRTQANSLHDEPIIDEPYQLPSKWFVKSQS